MPIIEISSLTDSGVEIFSTLTEAQLRNRIEPDKGLLIAESPKVIHVALNAGYEPLALLTSWAQKNRRKLLNSLRLFIKSIIQRSICSKLLFQFSEIYSILDISLFIGSCKRLI